MFSSLPLPILCLLPSIFFLEIITFSHISATAAAGRGLCSPNAARGGKPLNHTPSLIINREQVEGELEVINRTLTTGPLLNHHQRVLPFLLLLVFARLIAARAGSRRTPPFCQPRGLAPFGTPLLFSHHSTPHQQR